MFGHNRFEAYQLSIQFLKLALRIAEEIPIGYSMVKDQLRRASLSIPLNIAEGSGKCQAPDRRRFYNIARGSAMECAAICDVLELIDSRFDGAAREGRELLKSVVCILTKVCGR